jgi:hypothetical protein
MSEEFRGDQYNTYTNVSLQNNFSEPATLTLFHQYSDDTGESQVWQNVAPGGVGGPMSVGYNTGFGHTGTDHWSAQADMASGRWLASLHACELQKGDADQTLVFSVGPSGSYGPGFSMNIPSGSCWTAMSQTS